MVPASKPVRVKVDWRLALMTAVAVPLTLGLGVWQLERAAFKRDLAHAHALAQAEPPASCAAKPAPFLRVLLHGRYLTERQILLDNRTHEGRAGYQVLTPFRCDSGAVVVVNRGWMAMPGNDRSQIPAWETPSGHLTVFASYGAFARSAPAHTDPFTAPWPARMDRYDPRLIGRLLGEPVPDREVDLDFGQPGAFIVEAEDHGISAERHVGYAVQWFAMALALSVWFGYHTFRGHADG